VRERQAEAVRAQCYREIEPEAAAELERPGLKGRLFLTEPTERVMPAEREVNERKKGDKPHVEKAKTVARAIKTTKGVGVTEPIDGDMRKAAPRPRKRPPSGT
jgi:hypothetical protein